MLKMKILNNRIRFATGTRIFLEFKYVFVRKHVKLMIIKIEYEGRMVNVRPK